MGPVGTVVTYPAGHPVATAAGEMTLQLSRHDDGVVVEVGDAGGGTPRRRRAAGDEGGRGLQLVGVLAAGWGVRYVGAGKIVWCRLGRRPL